MKVRNIAYRGVRRDQDGNRYLDVTSDALDEAGMLALLPLLVLKGEPNSATSNAATDTRSVSTPTTSDLRDLLSEADAILVDSSDSSAERLDDSSSCMKASSSSSVRSLRSALNGSTYVKSPILITASVLLALVIGVLLGRL